MNKFSKKYSFIFIALCLILIFLITTIYQNKIENKTFKITYDKIYFDNLPSNFDNYKILQITDLHSMEFGKNNSALINSIDKLNPDIIFVTGDMFSSSEFKKEDDTYDRNYDEESLIGFNLLKNLSQKYKIIYSVGNHEEGIDAIFNGYDWSLRDRTVDNAYNRYINKLKNLGVTFVDNSYTTISKDGESIDIYGIYYYSLNTYAKKITPSNISTLKFLDNVNKNEFNILISHDPKGAEILKDKNFDLVISGHIHGGIVRILDTAILDPARKLFPKYNKGIYQIANSKLYVSTGLGNTKFMRINNTPEINLITLKSN